MESFHGISQRNQSVSQTCCQLLSSCHCLCLVLSEGGLYLLVKQGEIKQLEHHGSYWGECGGRTPTNGRRLEGFLREVHAARLQGLLPRALPLRHAGLRQVLYVLAVRVCYGLLGVLPV